MTTYSGIYLHYEGTNSQCAAVQQNREITWADDIGVSGALRYLDCSGNVHFLQSNDYSGYLQTQINDNTTQITSTSGYLQTQIDDNYSEMTSMSGYFESNLVESLDDLNDVSISAPSSGEYLTYDGTSWNNTGAPSGTLAGLTSGYIPVANSPSSLKDSSLYISGSDNNLYIDAAQIRLLSPEFHDSRLVLDTTSSGTSHNPELIFSEGGVQKWRIYNRGSYNDKLLFDSSETGIVIDIDQDGEVDIKQNLTVRDGATIYENSAFLDNLQVGGDLNVLGDTKVGNFLTTTIQQVDLSSDDMVVTLSGSAIRVGRSVGGDPTNPSLCSFGISAGTYDGQILRIFAGGGTGYFELDDSVPGSAGIFPSDTITFAAGGSPPPEMVTFIWDDTSSVWRR